MPAREWLLEGDIFFFLWLVMCPGKCKNITKVCIREELISLTSWWEYINSVIRCSNTLFMIVPAKIVVGKIFVIQKLSSSIWRSRCWLWSLYGRGHCKHSASRSQKWHLCDCYWKDSVSGSISIDSFLLNSSTDPKGIISLYQYTILWEGGIFFFYCHPVLSFFKLFVQMQMQICKFICNLSCTVIAPSGQHN